jgi:hypothetical protein
MLKRVYITIVRTGQYGNYLPSPAAGDDYSCREKISGEERADFCAVVGTFQPFS